jgi:small subunit ribosomal protein S16
MAVVIRMRRAGAKKRPFYRVIVANSRSPRDGRYIEQLGYYDPLTNPATFRIDTERFANWIRNGAQPSESVGVMMAKHAPEALRPAPLAPAPVAAGEEPKPKKAKATKPTAAKKKIVRKPKAATKGSEKKAKSRAKAKAGKASGAVKPKAAKKTKK